MMTRLLVLWILSERSSYGYEIKKALGDDHMAFWFSVEDGSIYSALRTLTKRGDTRIVGAEQEGSRPIRTRYAITAQGRRYYRRLLTEALATPVLPIGPVDVALSARGDLDPAVVGEALSRRTKALDELTHQIDRARAGAPSQALVDRNVAIVAAERRWLADLDQATVT